MGYDITFKDRYGITLGKWKDWTGIVPGIGDTVRITNHDATCYKGKVIERDIERTFYENALTCIVEVEESY